jgi:O-antigen biosynthesis protein
VTPQRAFEAASAPLPERKRRPLAVPHSALRSLCIVTTELPHLLKNGGIGSCNWHLAALLARRGWRIHVLYCGQVSAAADKKKAAREMLKLGCSVSYLDDCEISKAARTPTCEPSWFLDCSDRVCNALQTLHRAYHFSLIEFADYQGIGFRPIQAKRTGLAFDDVCLIVKLHSSSQWVREANLSWVAHTDDLLLDHCERYAFDNADVQIAPCRYMLDFARSIGWQVKDDALVIPYVFPQPKSLAATAPAAIKEIVFFGRLETRKGLEVFVEAVSRLPASLKITFLGRNGALANGRAPDEAIRGALKGRSVKLLANLDRHEALAYLSKGRRLAVMPSLVDNSPNTVIECATHGIPFLASCAGGVPELLPDPELEAELLFEPNAKALAARLKRYLDLPPAERQLLTEKARRITEASANNEAVLVHYHELIQERVAPAVTASLSASSVRLAEEQPLVTVAVTYFNLPEFLPEALESLAAQTYANLEVLVVDDGSTNPVAIRVFEEQRRLYPQFRFLSQANGGLSAARNLALTEAAGEFFLPVDADNVAHPDMVAVFVRGLRRNPELSALACYYLAFDTDNDRKAGKCLYAYRPPGGPHVMASFRNVYGDANSIFRTADLRTINGYEPDRDSTCEDWEAFVKLINAGFKLDVLPEHLFFYRHRLDSLLRNTLPYRNQRRVLRHYFNMEELPKGERVGLWSVLHSLHAGATAGSNSVRYQTADCLNAALKKLPWLHFLIKKALVTFLIGRSAERFNGR